MKRDALDERVRGAITAALLHAVADTGENDTEDGGPALRSIGGISEDELELAGAALGELLVQTAAARQHGYESCDGLDFRDLIDQLHKQSCCEDTVLSFAFSIIFTFFEAADMSYAEAMIVLLGSLDHFVSMTEDSDLPKSPYHAVNTRGPTEDN